MRKRHKIKERLKNVLATSTIAPDNFIVTGEYNCPVNVRVDLVNNVTNLTKQMLLEETRTLNLLKITKPLNDLYFDLSEAIRSLNRNIEFISNHLIINL